jgi:hypothetical protein
VQAVVLAYESGLLQPGKTNSGERTETTLARDTSPHAGGGTTPGGR